MAATPQSFQIGHFDLPCGAKLSHLPSFQDMFTDAVEASDGTRRDRLEREKAPERDSKMRFQQ
jgi:hypothetical protein